MLNITDSLKIRVQDKLKIVLVYIHSQLLFELKTYDFALSWVEQTLDAMCFKYIRDWIEFPVSACLKELFILPKNKGGLGFRSFKNLTEKMRLVKQYTLMQQK